MKVKMYHNPRCRKSREALQILNDKGVEVEIVEYLKNIPSFDDLGEIVRLTGLQPLDLIRKNEQEFKDNYKEKDLSPEEWLRAIEKFPKLLERPVVLTDNRGVVARPPERVNEII